MLRECCPPFCKFSLALETGLVDEQSDLSCKPVASFYQVSLKKKEHAESGNGIFGSSFLTPFTIVGNMRALFSFFFIYELAENKIPAGEF